MYQLAWNLDEAAVLLEYASPVPGVTLNCEAGHWLIAGGPLC